MAKRNHELATEEKLKVENEQRIKSKKRLEDGVEFHPKFFREVNENDNGVKNLEYVIYKKFDLKEDPQVLRRDCLQLLRLFQDRSLMRNFITRLLKTGK